MFLNRKYKRLLSPIIFLMICGLGTTGIVFSSPKNEIDKLVSTDIELEKIMIFIF